MGWGLRKFGYTRVENKTLISSLFSLLFILPSRRLLWVGKRNKILSLTHYRAGQLIIGKRRNCFLPFFHSRNYILDKEALNFYASTQTTLLSILCVKHLRGVVIRQSLGCSYVKGGSLLVAWNKGHSANPKGKNSASIQSWFFGFSLAIFIFNLIRLMLLGLGVISYILLPCKNVWHVLGIREIQHWYQSGSCIVLIG